jgi:hypothetical protein
MLISRPRLPAAPAARMLISRPRLPAAALAPRISARPRLVVARALAVGALALLFTASVAVLTASSAKPALDSADAHFIATRVVSLDHDVRARLARVTSVGGLARARRAARDALAGLNSLARPVRASRDARAAPLAAAIADESRLLDAVGSALMNPRSPKLAALPALDGAARRSLAALAGTPSRAEGAIGSLVRWRGGGDGR